MFRPARLVDKWVETAPIDGYSLKRSWKEEISSVEFLGEQWVVSLRTTSKTFFAEGFSSHNCYLISDFCKDPKRIHQWGIEKEITEARKLMARLEFIKEKWWLGGNHEDRWRRVHWNHPTLQGMLKDFPEAFKMSDHGFKWKPYGAIHNLGKLMVMHGSMVNKHSGATARSHFEKLGSSVLLGHSHRMGAYYKTDTRGTHVAYEGGCLCRLDPEYVQYPDWQQGFSVVHVEKNGLFNVQQIPVLRRRALFYGATKRELKLSV